MKLKKGDEIFFEEINLDVLEEKETISNPICHSCRFEYPTRVVGSSKRIKELNEEAEEIMKKIDRSFLEY